MSETAKHTPGPWCVERPASGIGWLGLDGFLKDRPDALVISMPFPPFAFGRCGAIVLCDDDAELEANSNLIAAAPELLEALEIYLMAGHKEARREASVIAKAAIAKATGKEAE